jgi:hypothetical protein
MMDIDRITRAELLIKLSSGIYDVKGNNPNTTARAFEDLALKCATAAYEILKDQPNETKEKE